MSGNRKPGLNASIEIEEWHDHFKGIFNQMDSTDKSETVTVDDNEEEHDSDLNKDISEEEVMRSIRKLKSGKACGGDGILAEMLKAGGKDVITFLTKVFNAIFDSHEKCESM